jgi:hypothetical protein
MEKAYTERNARALQIEKTISLGALDSLALRDLIETGECAFALSEKLFYDDYPGHYARKISTLSVSIPAITGPYQNLHANDHCRPAMAARLQGRAQEDRPERQALPGEPLPGLAEYCTKCAVAWCRTGPVPACAISIGTSSTGGQAGRGGQTAPTNNGEAVLTSQKPLRLPVLNAMECGHRLLAWVCPLTSMITLGKRRRRLRRSAPCFPGLSLVIVSMVRWQNTTITRLAWPYDVAGIFDNDPCEARRRRISR